ncbi:hypothetical protein D5H75_09560 [Bailinhaonella thermotolerans]|uniref:Uncharacterized protein n=1 Tax=Bailinhaonella thermotolerans TaxID=1070861 RepID=A0A3A4B457_9ACTN|nr:hypothetical protein D5H75_09560 [Bailinhaonella thermotolerans]
MYLQAMSGLLRMSIFLRDPREPQLVQVYFQYRHAPLVQVLTLPPQSAATAETLAGEAAPAAPASAAVPVKSVRPPATAATMAAPRLRPVRMTSPLLLAAWPDARRPGASRMRGDDGPAHPTPR